MKEGAPASVSSEQQKESGSALEQSHAHMESLIGELALTSRFERERTSNSRERISSPERGEYNIRFVTDAKDPVVRGIHRTMVKEFGKEESETLTWLRHTIRKDLNRYHVAETPEGEVAAFSNTQYLELDPALGHENDPRESVIPIWHIVSDPAFRNKGVASELYQSFYQDALEEAKKRGDVIKGIIGEAVDSVEGFLNRMGRKRMYFEDSNGNVHEVPYVCPPVDMDDTTGEPREEPVPEHVMLRLVNGEEKIPNEDLVRIVKAMYTEYVGAPDNYDTQEAYQKALEYNMGLLGQLADAVGQSKDGSVFLMSKEEREKKREELAREHKELRELETGEEEIDEGE
ncbi:MAG: GNAT family N-acetyltransferase [bacterium]|nr:GNAT family N-acetyltransferase [bacterium]MDZ4299356.1 GNAT family N-acetyltransferase [Candidatus Sungbacteria bacterium]